MTKKILLNWSVTIWKRRINRESYWTESIAVCSLEYVNNIVSRLGVKLRSRTIKNIHKDSHMIREKEFGWRVLNGQFFKKHSLLSNKKSP